MNIKSSTPITMRAMVSAVSMFEGCSLVMVGNRLLSVQVRFRWYDGSIWMMTGIEMFVDDEVKTWTETPA